MVKQDTQMAWFTTCTATTFISLVTICYKTNDDDIIAVTTTKTTTAECYCLKIMYTGNVKISK
jgi:hypothetical protein